MKVPVTQKIVLVPFKIHMNLSRQDGDLSKPETDTSVHQNKLKTPGKTENNNLEKHTYLD